MPFYVFSSSGSGVCLSVVLLSLSRVPYPSWPNFSPAKWSGGMTDAQTETQMTQRRRAGDPDGNDGGYRVKTKSIPPYGVVRLYEGYTCSLAQGRREPEGLHRG